MNKENREKEFEKLEAEANIIRSKKAKERTKDEKQILKSLQNKIAKYRNKIGEAGKMFDKMSLEEKVKKKAAADKKEEMKILKNIEKLKGLGKLPLLHVKQIDKGKLPLLHVKLIDKGKLLLLHMKQTEEEKLFVIPVRR